MIAVSKQIYKNAGIGWEYALFPPEILFIDESNLEKMIFFRKGFPEFGYNVVVRPLCVERDNLILNKWASEQENEWITRLREVRRLFGMSRRGHVPESAYTLMAFIKKRPVAAVEVFDVPVIQVGNDISNDDDHGIELLMAHHSRIVPRRQVSAFAALLCFLFTLSVDRIIGSSSEKNIAMISMLEVVGFQFMKSLKTPYGNVSMYFLKRRNLKMKYS